MDLLKTPLSRRPFFVWGVVLMALKYTADRFVASFVFGRQWYLWDYFRQADQVSLLNLSADDRQFYLTLAVMSVPFAAVGVWLCFRRLMDAGLPRYLSLLFFLPFVNLLFFAGLTVIPSHAAVRGLPADGWMAHWLTSLRPRSRLGAMVFAVLLVGTLGALPLLLSIFVFESYGWGVFLGIPFFVGGTTVLVYGWGRKLKLSQAIALAMLSLVLMGGAMFVLAFEGLMCLIMAFPLAAPLAALGGALGYAVHHSMHARTQTQLMAVWVFVLPVLVSLEGVGTRQLPLQEVVTVVEIDAPPAEVWPQVIAFSQIPEPGPSDWLFRMGIAYPIRAEIFGKGVGAVRHCNFSTGPFVEPITVWDAPYRLAFDVTAQPAPMQEWTLYDELHPPHLSGFMLSQRGQFRLTELPGGRTRLEGTTWYTYDLQPGAYWQPITHYIIHQIHYRVLNHIRQETETKPSQLQGVVD